MRVVDSFRECDGWAVVVEREDRSRVRLHAQTKPRDVKAWAADAIAAQDQARADEVSREREEARQRRLDTANELLDAVERVQDPDAKAAARLLRRMRDGGVDLDTVR